MDNSSDEQLVEAYLKGDEPALAILIERHTKGIYHFSARFLGYGVEAEDITQEVFIKVWKSLKRFDKNKKFKTWLYRIARNTAIDYLRAHPRTLDLNKYNEDEDDDGLGEIPDLSPSPFDQLAVNEQTEKIRGAIASLPEIYRTVLDLHLRAEMSLAEIAEVLAEKEDTVKSRYRRGIFKLRKLLTN